MQTERKILSVPEPCSEDWNAMSETEKGRYCAVCDKTLVNFAEMSDEQIAKTIEDKKSKGEKVCGHFRNDQLNRPLHTVLQYSRQYISLPVIASGAMLLSSMHIEEGQSRAFQHTAGAIGVPNKIHVLGDVAEFDIEQRENVLHGQVLDERGKPAQYASIQAFNNETIEPVYTDKHGKFTLITSETENIMLFASYRNKSSSTILIPLLSNAPYITFTLNQSRLSNVTEGKVDFVLGGIGIDAYESENSISGILTDENGNPIADAMITVDVLKNRIYSKVDGTFTLPTLSAGDYIITIKHKDFKKKEIYRNVPSEFKRISIVLESE